VSLAVKQVYFSNSPISARRDGLHVYGRHSPRTNPRRQLGTRREGREARFGRGDSGKHERPRFEIHTHAIARTSRYSVPEFARLFAGGRWIRTSSTWAPVNRVIPLLCCPIAWDELARARVLLGSFDLTREEIWVNLID